MSIDDPLDDAMQMGAMDKADEQAGEHRLLPRLDILYLGSRGTVAKAFSTHHSAGL